MSEKLGQMLLRANLITEEQLDKALEEQKTNGEKIGFNLMKLGFSTEDDIASVLG